MDLSDLYSPEELAEKRISFLVCIIGYYTEISGVEERAKVIGHKLRGTGGTLGLTSLSEVAAELQDLINTNAAESTIAVKLGSIRPEIDAVMERERQIIEAA